MSGQDVSVPGRAGEEKIDRVEGGSDGRLYVMRCRSDKWGQISGTLLGQPHLHMNFRETCRPRATPARCPPLQQLMTQAPGRPGVAVSSSADCGGANQWGRHFGTKPSIWMGHDLFPAHMAARVSLPGFNYSNTALQLVVKPPQGLRLNSYFFPHVKMSSRVILSMASRRAWLSSPAKAFQAPIQRRLASTEPQQPSPLVRPSPSSLSHPAGCLFLTDTSPLPVPVLQGLHQTCREGSTHRHVHLPAGLLGLGQAGAG